MGIHNKWTDYQVEYLRENWGHIPAQTIGQRLGRSLDGIKVKAKRLKLGGATVAGESVTARQASRLLSVDSHAVLRWINKYGLKSKRQAISGKLKIHTIRLDDLCEWLRNNPDKYNSLRIEPYALGQEPEWFREKRKKDRLKNDAELAKQYIELARKEPRFGSAD